MAVCHVQVTAIAFYIYAGNLTLPSTIVIIMQGSVITWSSDVVACVFQRRRRRMSGAAAVGVAALIISDVHVRAALGRDDACCRYGSWWVFARRRTHLRCLSRRSRSNDIHVTLDLGEQRPAYARTANLLNSCFLPWPVARASSGKAVCLQNWTLILRRKCAHCASALRPVSSHCSGVCHHPTILRVRNTGCIGGHKARQIVHSCVQRYARACRGMRLSCNLLSRPGWQGRGPREFGKILD
jgi:hypothetical protein